ncbi:MAG TPA: mechanosensitive ion channel family protein [Chitinophagaceae bacterium]|nr:mechanosensitive ion channel family protein [Chitinophagaceae bacterium]
MNNFWNTIYLNNTVRDWAIALSIILGLLLLIRFFRLIVFRRIKGWAQRTESKVDDFAVRIIERSILPLLYLASVYSGVSYLAFPARVERIIHVAFLVAGTFFVLRLISAFIHFFLFRAIRHHENRDSKEKQLRGILLIINIVVWIIGLVFLLDNLGYNVTAVITGLGIGGIAIALASQVILGDLFSYFVIFFDRPFEIGDFIVVDDKSGTVEYVGIKTTRVRALSGEQLIFSNTNLTNSRVHNFKRMQLRRIVFTLGIVYETPAEKLKKIPGMVKDIITAQPDLVFDRGHFAGYGDFSLKFEFVYLVKSDDYNLYMDRQQSIYLAIFEAFEKEGIAFAYPTQSVLVNMQQKENGGADAAVTSAPVAGPAPE